eukprot:g45307.t1
MVAESSFTDQVPVTINVTRGFVLGPLLLTIYVKDLNRKMKGMVSTFRIDTKIGSIMDSEERYTRLQKDCDQLGQWVEEWQAEFNGAMRHNGSGSEIFE